VDSVILSLSIVPYLLFLYLIWRIYKLEPGLLNRTTVTGFFAMLGFIFVTAGAGIIALKLMGAKTLGHVDWLHGLAEFGLTITNGLVALGLKKQLNEIELAEIDRDSTDVAVEAEATAPVLINQR